VQLELDALQVSAVSALRRLDPTAEPLTTQAGIVEHDLDRLHALGGSPGGGATAVDKLGEFGAQRRLQGLHKPRRHASPLACCETQPRVRSDDDLDAAADNLAVATCVRPAAVPPGHLRRAVGIAASPSEVLLFAMR
jgi:hypothetical protein